MSYYFSMLCQSTERGDPVAWRRGLEVCVGALRFAEPSGPWLALRSRLASRLGGQAEQARVETTQSDDPGHGPRECFLWGALRLVEKRPTEAIPWLKQAVRRDEGNYWYQFYLGFASDGTVAVVPEALRHYDAAAMRCNLVRRMFGSRGRGCTAWRIRGHWPAKSSSVPLPITRRYPNGCETGHSKLKRGWS